MEMNASKKLSELKQVRTDAESKRSLAHVSSIRLVLHLSTVHVFTYI